MKETIQTYRTAIEELCHTFFKKATAIGWQRFKWNDISYLWYTYLIKEGEKVLNKMTYHLNSGEFKELARQLQNIAEQEFEKLKFRIDKESSN